MQTLDRILIVLDAIVRLVLHGESDADLGEQVLERPSCGERYADSAPGRLVDAVQKVLILVQLETGTPTAFRLLMRTLERLDLPPKIADLAIEVGDPDHESGDDHEPHQVMKRGDHDVRIEHCLCDHSAPPGPGGPDMQWLSTAG